MNITWFIVIAFMPIVCLSAGLILKKIATSEPNSLIGYRTRRSSSSQQTWNYANSLASKIFFGIGIFTLLTGIFTLVLLRNSTEQRLETWMVTHLYLSVGLLFGTLPIIEMNLRKKYDKNGKEK